jgi:hypothetical protein
MLQDQPTRAVTDPAFLHDRVASCESAGGALPIHHSGFGHFSLPTKAHEIELQQGCLPLGHEREHVSTCVILSMGEYILLNRSTSKNYHSSVAPRDVTRGDSRRF